MKEYKKGLTLIELLVVVSVIGILSIIITISLGKVREQARFAAAQLSAKSIQSMFFAKEYSTDRNVFTLWYGANSIEEVSSSSPYVLDLSGENNHLIGLGYPGIPFEFSTQTPTKGGGSMKLENNSLFRANVHGISNEPVSKITISTWIRIDDLDSLDGSSRHIIQFAGSSGIKAGINNEPCFYINAHTNICSDKGFKENSWHYIIGAYSGDTETLSLYLDGQLVATSSAPQTISFSDKSFYLGSPGFNGYLDEVMVLPLTFSKGSI